MVKLMILIDDINEILSIAREANISIDNDDSDGNDETNIQWHREEEMAAK